MSTTGWRITVVAALWGASILPGCNWLWPMTRADDPRRCGDECDPGKVCYEGRCVPPKQDGGIDLVSINDGSPQDDAPTDISPSDNISYSDIGPWGPPAAWKTIPPSSSSGTFQMGSIGPPSANSDPCRTGDEPSHQVTLTHRIEIQTTEVTQGQFLREMGYNPSYDSNCGITCPVEGVTWHEAAMYSNRLSQKSGYASCYTDVGSGKGCSAATACPPREVCITGVCRMFEEASQYPGQKMYECPGFRLPTEAEWEFAYRAGTTTAYYSGANDGTVCAKCNPPDANLAGIAWYCANSKAVLHPVGGKTQNAWGLFDMAGNVWEWCHDWHDTEAYTKTSNTDPIVSSASSTPNRVARGGAYDYFPGHARASFRGNYSPEKSYENLGFRVCRTINK